MNRFMCCGVVTAIKKETRKTSMYTIQDQYRDKSTGKIGIETYYIHAPAADDIVVGDVVCAIGSYDDAEYAFLEAVAIKKIGVLLINNLLTQFTDEIDTCEEMIKDAIVSKEWDNEMQ